MVTQPIAVVASFVVVGAPGTRPVADGANHRWVQQCRDIAKLTVLGHVTQ